MTVDQAFDDLLAQVYGDASDMDPQQRSDLRDFFFMGAKHGLVVGSGDLAAAAAELRRFGEQFMLQMAKRVEQTN